MRKLWAVMAALLTLSVSGCGYNTLQSNDEQLKSSWSEVVNQYQRRADLVPKDVLVDDKAWAIRYLGVDTEHWWAGKTVLVSPGWLTRVAWDESKTLFCLVTAVGDAGAAGRPVLTERASRLVESAARSKCAAQ